MIKIRDKRGATYLACSHRCLLCYQYDDCDEYVFDLACGNVCIPRVRYARASGRSFRPTYLQTVSHTIIELTVTKEEIKSYFIFLARCFLSHISDYLIILTSLS